MRQPDTLENTLKTYQREVDDIKTKQFAGSSDIKIREYASENEWDVDETVTFIGGVGDPTRVWRFFYITDNQVAPFASFHPNILVNGVAYDAGSSGTTDYDDQNTLNIGYGTYYDETTLPNTEEIIHTIACSINAFSNNALVFDLKIKMRVLANAPGTIRVVSA